MLTIKPNSHDELDRLRRLTIRGVTDNNGNERLSVHLDDVTGDVRTLHVAHDGGCDTHITRDPLGGVRMDVSKFIDRRALAESYQRDVDIVGQREAADEEDVRTTLEFSEPELEVILLHVAGRLCLQRASDVPWEAGDVVLSARRRDLWRDRLRGRHSRR